MSATDSAGAAPLPHALDHPHVFLGTTHARNERRTWIVAAVCAVTMVAEIAGGLAFRSMALVAEGLHMATHVGALMIAALAYAYARRHAHNRRFSFGTGKVGDLAGFASAVSLAVMALVIAAESAGRLLHPVTVDFADALPVAVLGLAVSLISAWLLRDDPAAHAGHSHGAGEHDHHHHHGHDDHGGHDHAHGRVAGKAHAHDLNMRAAYVHVLTDALVSVLALLGLLAGQRLGWLWFDPVTGLVGAVVVAQFSVNLMRNAAGVLLDTEANPKLAEAVRTRVETEGDRVVDLHVWRVGPGHHAVIVAIATAGSATAADYRARLAGLKGLSHLTVEVVGA